MVEPVDLVEDRLFDGLEQLVQSLPLPLDLDPSAASAAGHRPRPNRPGPAKRLHCQLRPDSHNDWTEGRGQVNLSSASAGSKRLYGLYCCERDLRYNSLYPSLIGPPERTPGQQFEIEYP